MAEVHIIGQILKAVEFEEPHLFCKWSLQSGTVQFSYNSYDLM